jgi:hypothetical protein
VLWAEDRGLGSGLDIYGVRTTSAGIVVGAEVPIVVQAGDQSDPALAYNEQIGEFLVVYTNSGGPGVTPTPGVPIPGTQMPPQTPPPPPPPPPPLSVGAGASLLPPGAVEPLQPVPTVASPTPTGPPLPPPTLPTPGGGTVLPPTSLPPPEGTPPAPPSGAPGPRDIYGVWVSDSGLRVTNTFPIMTSPADETYPSLAYRARQGNDQWILVWREVTGLSVALRTVEMTGFGRTMVFSSGVNTVVSGADHGRPSVAASIQAEFLVAWSQSQGRADRDILARRLNSNGFPLGSIISLVESVEDQVYPSLGALRDTGDYLLAYEERPAGAESDIKIRRLNRNGAPLRSAYSVAAGPPFSFAPALPATSVNDLLLVWLDRNAASDNSVMGAEVIGERILGPQREIVAGGVGAKITPVATPPGPPFPPIPPPPP